MITQTQQMSPGKGIASCKKICLKELSDIPVITRLAGCLYKAVAPLIFGAFSCPAQRYFCFLSSFQSTLLPHLSSRDPDRGRAAGSGVFANNSPAEKVEGAPPCPRLSVYTYLSGLSF
jgi:hypothetical protein